MTSNTTKPDSLQPAAEMAVDLFDNWFDPIETEVRARAREFVEELIRGELDAVLARPRYGRSQMAGNEGRAGVAGHRHGSRTRSLTGTFGPIEIAVPRARLTTSEGKTVPGGPDQFTLKFDHQKEVWEAARRIDLFLWIDPQKRSWQPLYANDAIHRTTVCSLFGIQGEGGPSSLVK